MAALCVRGRTGLGLVHWLSAAAFLVAVAAPAAAAQPIIVMLDQARIVKLPERSTTLVIGNPLIADLSIEPGGIAVVTGKGYGATNVIVMDKSGTVLMEKMIEVRGPSDKIVVVYRGLTRETYSCTPDCSRRITLGDFPEYFDKTLAETTTLNAQASGAASGH